VLIERVIGGLGATVIVKVFGEPMHPSELVPVTVYTVFEGGVLTV
jgi:hypothetical protein